MSEQNSEFGAEQTQDDPFVGEGPAGDANPGDYRSNDQSGGQSPETGVTYAAKIDKGETRIDWSKPRQQVHDHIRGLSPFPGAWFTISGENGPVRVKVLRTTLGEGSGPPGTLLDDRLTVACGEGAVRILELQRAGRQAMKADEFLRGSSVAPGTVFG